MPADLYQYTTSLGPLEKYKNDLSFRLRTRIFDIFIKTFAPSPESRVADFGVSSHRTHPAHFFFEVLYPYKNRLTALGQESSYWYTERFPGLTYLNCDLRSIPLPDHYFDYGICNDVIEHAGCRNAQAQLVHEVCRTCKNVLFTTPNRAFFIETHTFVPFFHWLPGSVFRSILQSLGYRHLAREENLNPVDTRTLLSLFPKSRRTQVVRMSTVLPMKLLSFSSIAGPVLLPDAGAFSPQQESLLTEVSS